MTTIAAVVAADLCVGCGLCEAVSGGRVTMEIDARGSLRPTPVDRFTAAEEAMLLHACPGVVAEARADSTLPLDPIWGHHGTMALAWAADPDVRFRASAGGVLTALGVHLLTSGSVAFVLHVGPERGRPMRSRWVMSETADEVIANAGSRYGPTAPLAGVRTSLARGEPFAVIAKPCDLGALHRHARFDPRIDELCVARLALVCGGQSRLSKSTALLEEIGVDEREVTLFRYRGHGNPGRTRIETRGGSVHEKTYLELWEDESAWQLETRCKVCPDALGEAADISAADAWPGGAPAGEDEGFNTIVVRSDSGGRLLAAAVDAGQVVLGEAIGPRTFDELQPHQVRKKIALAARYEGMADAGVAPIETHGLRVAELGERLTAEARAAERAGTARRMLEARRAGP